MHAITSETVVEPHYDVAIIGFGPTGAVLANLLALCGVRVLVVEREAGIYPLPRAVHFDDETMRVFQTVGIADTLSQKVRVNPGMRFIDANNHILLDWPRPRELTPQGWHASYRFHQPDLELLLRQAARGRDTITVKTETKMVALSPASDHVLLHCYDRARNRWFEVSACYVVGCDGARSPVRRAMGVEMEDFGFKQSWLVVDVLLKRAMPKLGDHSVQFCDAERPMTYCRSPENRRRWEITMRPGETANYMTDPDRVWQFLSRWITPKDAELERTAVYTFESALAKQWHQDRLLLAGDAAHLTPPFMGQGMCAGIRDAANLAWKLALKLRGQAPVSLLDSYSAERRPNMRAYIETAIDLGYLINSIDRDNLQQLNGVGTQKNRKMASISPGLGLAGARCFGLLPSARCGELFGQPQLSGHGRADDYVGYRPVLISRVPCATTLHQGQPVQLNAQSEPSLKTALDELDVAGVLIRPDRYILATAASQKELAPLAQIDFGTPQGQPL